MSVLTPINKLKMELNDNNFFVKRDDLLPFSFGGNKARKAVYFFDEIEKNNNDVIVTYGSSSSNHCRIIANMAASRGLECYIISPQEGYEETSNSKMVALFGAKIIKMPLNDVANTIEQIMKDLKKKHNPYFIQGGGHGNIGTEAYVHAYKEIKDYEKEENINFDYIFLASGTGTTQAGLVAGKIKAEDINKKIIGISIARKNPRGGDVVAQSVRDYFMDGKDYDEEINFIDEYICGGYGKSNDEIDKIVKDVLLYEGMPLNSTYTGKAFWGMKRFIEETNIKEKNILFINTGGTPLFFDDLGELIK